MIGEEMERRCEEIIECFSACLDIAERVSVEEEKRGASRSLVAAERGSMPTMRNVSWLISSYLSEPNPLHLLLQERRWLARDVISSASPPPSHPLFCSEPSGFEIDTRCIILPNTLFISDSFASASLGAHLRQHQRDRAEMIDDSPTLKIGRDGMMVQS